MSEHDPFERGLRESMSRDAVPSLSPGFDRRLTQRLTPARRPRRLSPGGRVALLLYAVAALVLSVGVMRAESVGWLSIAVAMAAPLLGIAALRSRQRRAIP